MRTIWNWNYALMILGRDCLKRRVANYGRPISILWLSEAPELSKSNNPVGPNSITQGLHEMLSAITGMALDKKLDLLDRIEARLGDGLSALTSHSMNSLSGRVSKLPCQTL